MKQLIGITTLVISLLTTLSSCVPTAIVIGATAGGAIVYDKRDFKTILQDRYATQKAQGRINFNQTLRGRSHIGVATFDHIMLLVGQAQTPALRQTAYGIASQIKYVKRIYNQISIAGPISLIQRNNDAWLTTKVKTAMLAKKGLHSTQIKVVTEDSTVYLMGLVNLSQAKLATDVARRVAGVRKVVKVFEYSR